MDKRRTSSFRLPWPALLAAALALPAFGQGRGQNRVLDATVTPPGRVSRAEFDWDARNVEHLLNRAGFGARPSEIRHWLERGPEALIEHLFAERPDSEPYFVEPLFYDRDRLSLMSDEAQQRERAELRLRNRRQGQDFLAWWVQRMAAGDDPLRERMTLFWHGFFTSSQTKVRLSHAMIDQNQLLREHALGNYGELLAAILRDPAMLTYLDNVSNSRGNPNENLARELMELFSLGEGHYSENDVKEVARALTGYGVRRGRGFQFEPRMHDFAEKTVLGKSGRFDADDVVEILLAQPACARWVAGQMLMYLEGVAPSDERLDAYAQCLRKSDYEVAPLLDKLFRDPAFYRDEIVAARVLSPIDFLVGSCRRLGVEANPNFVLTGATLLGQQLFEPPNVKGWEEGYAWITTASFMNRGNLMGMILGVVRGTDLVDDPILTMGNPDSEMVASADVELAETSLAMSGESELLDDETLADEMASVDALGEMQAAGDNELEMMSADEPDPDPERRRRTAPGANGVRSEVLGRMLRLMESSGDQPRIHLSARLAKRGHHTDKAIVDDLCDELLAIDAPDETRRTLVGFLKKEREVLGIAHGELLENGADAEWLLRRLAHLILSLPEAQLG